MKGAESARQQKPETTVPITVKMGEGTVSREPYVIQSVGLGSCVAVALYDAERRIGGLAHVALSNSAGIDRRDNPYQCADTAIAALLEQMHTGGAAHGAVVAKLAGGARTFPPYDGSAKGIGRQIIQHIRLLLQERAIPVVAEDVGKHHGRSVEFHLTTGELVVQALDRPEKRL